LVELVACQQAAGVVRVAVQAWVVFKAWVVVDAAAKAQVAVVVAAETARAVDVQVAAAVAEVSNDDVCTNP
jgi:hypothetical protein